MFAIWTRGGLVAKSRLVGPKGLRLETRIYTQDMLYRWNRSMLNLSGINRPPAGVVQNSKREGGGSPLPSDPRLRVPSQNRPRVAKVGR
ncbi:hypothetical protein AVEN_132604-1 [Araneus ventricosus]|uniref:Uncharacterized protein n=1 Tax=Araneus ventricosus TaxID=182803 RepID=A0A4Y2AXV1_ARAVE|nr:hypothetical protein AVEN_132604-1 [Araneus ventricosus]